MADEPWQKVRKVFDAALVQRPEEREQFLIEACANDKVLLHEVKSLLAALDNADNFLETPAITKVADAFRNNPRTFAAGEFLGHYEIISQLGAGGMGEVYMARDRKLDRKVAIKILREDFSHHPSSLKRFIQEAKLASALNHPNILVVHEVGEVEGTHFIVSEFVEGKTFREIIKQSSLTLTEILDISIQTAHAIAAAHEANLVHRDIKPENIMVRPDGFVKVLDFGLAKLVEQKNKSLLGLGGAARKQNDTAEGMILGTISYMSPEQARGKDLDGRTDIWSLGVCLFETVTGELPFAGETTGDTISAILNKAPAPLAAFTPNVPRELVRITGKALSKGRDERYQDIKDLLSDLRDLKQKSEFETRLGSFALPLNAGSNAGHQLSGETDVAKWPPQLIERSSTNQSGFKKLLLPVSTILVIGIIFTGFWHSRSKNTEPRSPVLSAPFGVEKLSTNGKVFNAVISRDGKSIVYTTELGGKQGVWLRQLESTANVEIIPPSDNLYYSVALSPDAKFLYFERRPKGVDQEPNIYRVSIFGGVPTRIVSGTQGSFSISADGKKIVFRRHHNKEDDNWSLWIADALDGTNERKLASRPRPARIGDSQISPDGRSVAFAAGQSANAANEFSLLEVDVETGKERELTAEKFFTIGGLAWLPGKDGLLFTARKNSERNDRIWYLSVESGKVEPLTKDSESYSGLSLDQEARVIAATQIKPEFHLSLLQSEDAAARRVLTDAITVAFAPDGKIVFSSSLSGNKEIWSINPDGSERRQLTSDGTDKSDPIVSPVGDSIFFASNRTGEWQVWRINAHGSNPTQITRTEGGFPRFASADGDWLYYCSALQKNLWRVSTTGGEEQLVLDKGQDFFAFSPDGSLIAYFEKQDAESAVRIVSLNGKQTVKVLRLEKGKTHHGNLVWSRDGKNLAYVLADTEYENNILWLQSLDAGRPRQIAHLGNEYVRNFALSPDGRSFAVVQGGWRHDAVLLKGLR